MCGAPRENVGRGTGLRQYIRVADMHRMRRLRKSKKKKSKKNFWGQVFDGILDSIFARWP